MAHRELTPETVEALRGWAKHHAAMFIENREDGPLVTRTKFTKGAKEGELVEVRHFSRDWIMLQFFNFTFKDEFELIVGEFRKLLGPDALADFNARIARLPSRSDETFARLLHEKQPAGFHPKGA